MKQHVWKKGSQPCLYGSQWIAAVRDVGRAVIVEGESDSLTCWYHGFPALGLPGAGNWDEGRDAPLLADVPVIYVVVEPDEGGNRVQEWVARSAIAPRARLVRLPNGTKDPSALYLADPGGFRAAFQQALDAAEPCPVVEAAPQPAASPQLDELSALIEEFNSRYAVVNEAGLAVIYEQIVDPIMNRKVLVRIKFPDLKKFYQNRLITVRTVDGGSITKTAAEWWLNHKPTPNAAHRSAVVMYGGNERSPRKLILPRT